MVRVAGLLGVFLALVLAVSSEARATSASVQAEIPASIESCFKSKIAGILNINRADKKALFDYFLDLIDVEQFGRYNFKRAWVQWGRNEEIKRLALYEYFSLMASNRAEHGGDTTRISARLADRPLVSGENVYHIAARAHFADGSSAVVVVFTHGCKPFGFMYGGSNLRSFMDVNLIERQYRAGKRSPF